MAACINPGTTLVGGPSRGGQAVNAHCALWEAGPAGFRITVQSGQEYDARAEGGGVEFNVSKLVI